MKREIRSLIAAVYKLILERMEKNGKRSGKCLVNWWKERKRLKNKRK